jgi:nucleoside-diphosphate-sugar epimerase
MYLRLVLLCGLVGAVAEAHSTGSHCTPHTLNETIEHSLRRAPKPRRRALVTGAAGFIGSHVAEFCAGRLGFFVVGVDDLSGGFVENFAPAERHGAKFFRGDVQDDDFVRRVWKRYGPFDYVYHLAAYAAEGLSHFIRRYNYMNNLVASVTLLDAAVRQADDGPPLRRFVFTSSIAAFGSVLDPSELPMTEATPQRPEDPYGVAKVGAAAFFAPKANATRARRPAIGHAPTPRTTATPGMLEGAIARP